MAETKNPQELVINTSTFVGSTYAQLVNVTVSDLDVTFEFSFIHPRTPDKGEVVSRVTVPKEIALKIPELILTVNKFHEKQKEGKKNG